MKYLKITGFVALFLGMAAVTLGQAEPKTEEFEAAGIKVILRHSVKGTVSARLFIEGGAANYPKSKEGIAALAYQTVVDGGPEGMTKQEYQQATERIGASLGSSAGYDYSNISLNCVKMYWDDAWKLYAQTIVNPAFRDEDFEIVKNQMVTAAKQAKSNPDSHLRKLAMEKAWYGTNYEKDPSGTPSSLESITLPEVQSFYQKVVGKKRVFLVVVGDITRQDLTAKIESGLGDLPAGSEAPEIHQTQSLGAGVYIEDRPIETNYILGMMSAPKKGSVESVNNSLAMSILYDRYFEELRTKRSLSYAPAASATGYIAHPMNMVYITTTDPKQSLQVMMELLNQAKTEGFDEKELEGTKQSFLTSHYMGQESNSSISMTLGVNEIRGDWSNADKFAERVLNTDVADINRVMREYGDRINWVYLGKEDQVSPDDFTQPVGPKKVKD